MTIEQAEKDGYKHVKLIKMGDEVVLCGLERMAFTTGLIMGISPIGYAGRWCFDSHAEALRVLTLLEEIPENLIIPGNWVKYKGYPREIVNSKYIRNENDYDGIAPQLQHLLFGAAQGG